MGSAKIFKSPIFSSANTHNTHAARLHFLVDHSSWSSEPHRGPRKRGVHAPRSDLSLNHTTRLDSNPRLSPRWPQHCFMQAIHTPSGQHHDLKRPSDLPSENDLLTWQLQPWPVHTKRERKRRQAVPHVGDMFSAALALQPPPLFVSGYDGPELAEPQQVSTDDNAVDAAAKVRHGCRAVKPPVNGEPACLMHLDPRARWRARGATPPERPPTASKTCRCAFAHTCDHLVLMMMITHRTVASAAKAPPTPTATLGKSTVPCHACRPTHLPRYGEKVLKETGVPRSYYKCSVPGCNAKKYVEYTEDGDIAECIIKGEHNHSRSRAGRASEGGTVRASTRRRQPKPLLVVCR